MPKLSVVIITYNEEKNIGRCLESIKDIADDIVVVDSYSTDRTEEIVRSYNARFIQHPFDGHIQQKNWAITQAKYPHILSLDADEEPSDELKESILEIKNNWQYDGYFFNRLTNYCGKWIRHTSWYPARKLRLWDSRKGKWGGINPHDKFLLEKGSSRKFLKGDLYHYSYYSINEHIQQINKFSSIVANAYFAEKRKASYFNIFFHPIWRLFRDYIIKLGFLDGFYGLVISVNSAHETFLKYSKLRNLYREKAHEAKTKICFFNSVLSWGGGERWHLDVSETMIKKGYEVLLVSHPRSELAKRSVRKNIPFQAVRISNLSFLNPFKIYKISKLLKEQRIGTIIINLSSDLKVAGVAAKLAGVKNIIYRRGSAVAIRNTFLNRYLYRRIVTRIIANSQETSRTILQNNDKLIPRRKIEVIYNGIDLSAYDNQPFELLYQREGDELIIGNAGRLSEEKGQYYLVDLAYKMKSAGYKFKILIAGKGKLKSRLHKYARSRGVEEFIVFLGFVRNIKSFNYTIDIFALTSLYEGFGYVLVEAMAARKPVIAFDINSSAEIIQHGVSGYLVEKGNVEELFEKVRMLKENPDEARRLGESGRERVREVFTFEESMERVEKLIKSNGNGIKGRIPPKEDQAKLFRDLSA
ncbi:MAG: glycosyltransferase [Bacteroidota bacterium]